MPIKIDFVEGCDDSKLLPGVDSQSQPKSMPMNPSIDTPNLLAEFLQIASNRRSVYSYLPESVPPDILKQAVTAASLAPRHHRTTPWRFHIFADAARANLVQAYMVAARRLDKDVDRAAQRALDAPTMIVIACVPAVSNPKVKRWEEEFATAAAVQNLMLCLSAAGIASLLTTGELPESVEVRDLIGLEQPEARLMGVLNVGYRNAERPLQSRPTVDLGDVTQWHTQP